MKNGICISLLSLALIACGGESDSKTHTISTKFSAGIKGLEAEPTLVAGTISEGDIASLNTNYTGNVLEDSEVKFSFTLTENKQVALVLSSGASNLDLTVRGNNITLDSFYDDSNELIVFDALAGESYTITVEAWEDAGEFQLKLVEANRSSIGLKSNEYLVNLESIDTNKCVEDGVDKEAYTNTDSTYVIINWAEGYVSDSLGNERTSFSSVDGNTFTIDASYSASESGNSSSSQLTLILATDFTTGVITGTGRGSFEFSEPGEVSRCNYTSVESGLIIL